MTIDTQKLLTAHGSIAPLSPMRLERLDVRALQQLDYSGPGSRGKSIYVGATEVLELVAAARALTDAQNALDAQAAEIARLRDALLWNAGALQACCSEGIREASNITIASETKCFSEILDMADAALAQEQGGSDA
ncbi:MAG: hypothetical protein KUL86_12620 [Castellaniella sp.]|nr:hypothetical protein [Castellaniella sp.]